MTFELKRGIKQAYEAAAPKGFLESIGLDAVGIEAASKSAGAGDEDDRCQYQLFLSLFFLFSLSSATIVTALLIFGLAGAESCCGTERWMLSMITGSTLT